MRRAVTRMLRLPEQSGGENEMFGAVRPEGRAVFVEGNIVSM